LRQPHFIVWDNSDLVTHEVMGGLKNVYAIGAGKTNFYVLFWLSTLLYNWHLLLDVEESITNIEMFFFA
jgi:hypothetical protein